MDNNTKMDNSENCENYDLQTDAKLGNNTNSAQMYTPRASVHIEQRTHTGMCPSFKLNAQAPVYTPLPMHSQLDGLVDFNTPEIDNNAGEFNGAITGHSDPLCEASGW